MNRKAIIFGLKGTKLTKDEARLLKKNKPWGIILFSRNIKNLFQLKSLVSQIKNCTNDRKYPILIDQEGGSVSRLNKIVDLSLFSQQYFGKIYKKNKSSFHTYYSIYINAVCDILKKAGININTVPVLDVLQKYTHKIIKNRSFSNNATLVSKIGSYCIKQYLKNSIGTVVKHIPGHGRARCDSHLDLPIVTASKEELIKKDFKAFKGCHSFFAMTAHVIYKSYDSKFPATHSKIIIKDVIRKHIKFKGILISDDISMKALKHGLEKNTTKALQAGCNLILHCNGNIKEMKKLAKIVPKIDKFTRKKTSDFYNFLG